MVHGSEPGSIRQIMHIVQIIQTRNIYPPLEISRSRIDDLCELCKQFLSRGASPNHSSLGAPIELPSPTIWHVSRNLGKFER